MLKSEMEDMQSQLEHVNKSKVITLSKDLEDLENGI